MATAWRVRNQELEALEREGYRILQLAYGRTGGAHDLAVLCSKLADDLGLSRRHAHRIIAALAADGYLIYSPNGPTVSVSPLGRAYLEKLARRRRSVRLAEGALPDGPPSVTV